MIYTQLIYAACVVGGCLIAYPYGLVAVATAVSIAVAILYCVINYNACRLAGIDLATFAQAHIHGLLLTLTCMFVAMPIVLTMRAASASAFMVLLTTGAALALLSAALIWLKPRWLLGDVTMELLGDAQSKLLRRQRAKNEQQGPRK
jgi:PST family polysaccharide transporter